MTGLLAVVGGIAVIDSLNPSALLMTLYLTLDARVPAARVLAYIAGVFAAYLLSGILLMLGVDVVLAAAGASVASPVVSVAQGLLGAVMLGYALVAPNQATARPTPRLPRLYTPGALFGLGITITVVEFSTALPYLGAIGILTNADLPLVQWLPILVGYNLVFVLPPLALLLAYRLFGAPLEWSFGALQAGLQRGTREAMLWIFGLVGFGLLANSLSRMFALA